MLILLLIFSGLYLVPFQSYVVPLMQEDFGLSESISGICWGILGVLGLGSGVLGGILADKFSAKKAMIITYSVSVLSVVLVISLRNAAGVLMACGVFGLIYNAIFGLHPTYVSKTLPPEKTAKLFGLLNLSLGIGSMAGNYFGGYIKESTGSFIILYQLMGVVSVLAVGVCFVIKKDKLKE